MHFILALVKSPSTRIIRDWKGRCGEKRRRGTDRELEKGGRNDHGSSCGAGMLLNGPQSQWDVTLMTDAPPENALLQRAWNYSGPSWVLMGEKTYPEVWKLSQLSTCILPPPFQMLTLTYMPRSQETDMLTHILAVMHPPKHTHACNKTIPPPPVR